MPHDVLDNLRDRKPFDRSKWLEKMEQKAPKRKPVRTKVNIKDLRGTLGASRNYRLVIREAALRRVLVIITYKKTTTNSIVKYLVEPYSYRTRKLKVGRRKVLFAFDTHKLPNTDPHRSKAEAERSKKPSIKSYAMSNIRKAVLTDTKYKPRWDVEIR